MSTAEPTLAMVWAPAWMGALGIVVSPRVNVIRLIGRPSASEATCVIEVYVPGPMSLVALITSAPPSALILARASVAPRTAWYAAAAMPIPIRRSPSLRARGIGLRRDQSKPCDPAR